jgi:hypothetical protein
VAKAAAASKAAKKIMAAASAKMAYGGGVSGVASRHQAWRQGAHGSIEKASISVMKQ